MATEHAEIITDPVQDATCLKCHHLMDVSSLPAFVEIACPECGTKQRVPAKMGAFLLVDQLGKGGMGAVYRGRDTGLDRWVAVKVMQSSFGGNPEFVETFRREAQAAAALNHPNIVQIYSFGVSHGQPYMVMELLEGGRIDQMIAKGDFLDEAFVLKIAVDVAEGLNAAAAIGLIHGDIKPENILLDSNGIAKVVDFGLARFKEQKEGDTSKGIWGTPYYIAPEKLRGHQSDARSDIYSLGGTLFHALSLKPPFDGETPLDVVKARLKRPAAPLHTLRSNINREVEAIVARMLEADPLKRYPNYASVLADLRRVLFSLKPATAQIMGQPSKRGSRIVLAKKKGGATLVVPSAGAVAAMEPPDPVPEGKRKKKRKTVLWVVLGILAVVGLIAMVVVHQYNQTQKSEAAREKAKVKKYRQVSDQVWTDLQTVLVDVSNREVLARGWSSNANEVILMVSNGVSFLPDPAEFTGASSNTLAQAASITHYVTGVLATAVVELRNLSDLVNTNRQVILATTNAARAHSHLMLITNVQARSSDVLIPISDAGQSVAKSVAGLETLRKKFETAVKAAKLAADQAAIEKAAADKAAAEKAAAEKAAAEKAAKIQEELTLIAESRKSCAALVQQHQFKQALDTVTQAVKGLQTDEGKAMGKQVVKAYGYMVELKTAIIDGVKADVKANPGNGFQFGWLGSKDVLGITEEKVIIRGGEISWNEVPPKQMLRFVQRYVENGDLTRVEIVQHNFAMAMYINEATSGAEKSRGQSAKYLSEAVRGNARYEELAKAVLPDVEKK